jgi:hypothetical protein
MEWNIIEEIIVMIPPRMEPMTKLGKTAITALIVLTPCIKAKNTIFAPNTFRRLSLTKEQLFRMDESTSSFSYKMKK